MGNIVQVNKIVSFVSRLAKVPIFPKMDILGMRTSPQKWRKLVLQIITTTFRLLGNQTKHRVYNGIFVDKTLVRSKSFHKIKNSEEIY